MNPIFLNGFWFVGFTFLSFTIACKHRFFHFGTVARCIWVRGWSRTTTHVELCPSSILSCLLITLKLLGSSVVVIAFLSTRFFMYLLFIEVISQIAHEWRRLRSHRYNPSSTSKNSVQPPLVRSTHTAGRLCAKVRTQCQRRQKVSGRCWRSWQQSLDDRRSDDRDGILLCRSWKTSVVEDSWIFYWGWLVDIQGGCIQALPRRILWWRCSATFL